MARLAKRAGAKVFAFDSRTEDDSRIADSMATLASMGVPFSGTRTEPFGSEIDMLVTSPGVDRRKPILQESASSGVEVIGEVEFAFRLARVPVVAITGTNGKSTTTVMTWTCLREAGADAILCGNIFGSGYPEMPLSEAVAMARLGQVLVAEVSSFQLEWVRDFRPIAAGITNISSDHQDRYDSFEDYVATKQRVFAAMGGDNVAVCRSGDSSSRPPEGLIRQTFGERGDDAWSDGSRIWLKDDSVLISRLPAQEPHNLLNAMMAGLLAMGALSQLSAPAESSALVLQGLTKFRALGHRMQRIGESRGILLVNNSMCTNPQAVVESSRGLDRRQHLLVGGKDKDLDFSPLRELGSGTSHKLYLFGSAASEIRAVLKGEVPVFTTMGEAFVAAAAEAKAGDAIVLSPGCASQDQFVDFRERGDVFTRMAKEWLEK